ncbi:hypothetical protein ANN_08727 [Periplaneta americana]|uniref:Uncharacterized protein n=1 Tax=Periplaneta americana TaxID=6978 RepID=A0ABQ8T3V5_PERAM|nr:hypothetical protein ANN_08727 [Periplaneta americana]
MRSLLCIQDWKQYTERIFTTYFRKDQARKEKESDKNGSTKVYTMDLQAVLLFPFLKTSGLYYKTKLKVTCTQRMDTFSVERVADEFASIVVHS